MYEKICIVSKGQQPLNVSLLIDTMLFYSEVNVFVLKEGLVNLLRCFGPEFLADLINEKRLRLHILRNHVGSTVVPKDAQKQFGLDILTSKTVDKEESLFRAYKEFDDNLVAARRFAKRFSFVTSSYYYKQELGNILKEDLHNANYLNKSFLEYLKQQYPMYSQTNDLIFEIEDVNDGYCPFDLYNIQSNLDIPQLNKLNEEMGIHSEFDYSSFLLSLEEARGDNYVAATFNGELETNNMSSRLINLQLTDCLSRRQKSQEEINLFQNHIICKYPSLGDAYVKKVISSRQLLLLLEEGDRFRTWLSGVSNDESLINKYLEEATNKILVDNPFIKTIRVVLCFLFGCMSNGLGLAISAGDAFFGDRLIKGWTPNLYIDNKLKPVLGGNLLL